MQLIKRITGVLVIVIFCAQCKSSAKDGFTLTVNYKNANNLIAKPVKIILEEIPYGGDNRPIILDSAVLTGNKGSIELKGSGKEESVYGLIVINGPVMLLINDEAEITVDVDFSKKDNYYKISGSDASNELRKFIEGYGVKSAPVNMAFGELDSLKKLFAQDSLLLAATARKNSAITGLNTYMTNFISTSQDPAVCLFALGLSSRSLPKEDFEKILNETVKKFPEHTALAKLKTTYDVQQAQAKQQEQEKEAHGGWVGKPAPDLAMPSVNGDTISISSFKGKYVLVDFWASWCGPCRAENPNLVKAYKRFKDKNFTVLGVSLDRSREPWLKAIKDDRLEWPQMSDLQFWNSKAVEVYKFEGIPFNVLIDPQGIIIAEGLRGDDLEKKLVEVLK